MIFWYSVCLFLFLFVCTSYCADFARKIWSNLSEEQLLDLSTEVLRAKKKSVERLSSQILRRMLSWKILKKKENGMWAWPLQFVRRYQKYWQAYKYFPGAFGRYYGRWCLNWKKNIHACYSMIASCRNRLGIGQGK